jgi:hypothetical protein
MTLRLMPTSSHYDRALASKIHHEKGGYDQSVRSLFLLRGSDRAGLNDFQIQPGAAQRA